MSREAAVTLTPEMNDTVKGLLRLGSSAMDIYVLTMIAEMEKQRDAAVKDLEALMQQVNTADACEICARDGNGCNSNLGAASCRPRWRGPTSARQEDQAAGMTDEQALEEMYKLYRSDCLLDAPSDEAVRIAIEAIKARIDARKEARA